MSADDPFDLQRFVAAHDAGDAYHHALKELQQGRKVGHWMWFVFPQIAGLGQSPTSRRFAISSLTEARAYLGDATLGPRLLECAATVAATSETSAEEIFGFIDALKLRSSMTLFSLAAPQERVFAKVLDRFFDGIPDPRTEQLV